MSLLKTSLYDHVGVHLNLQAGDVLTLCMWSNLQFTLVCCTMYIDHS